MKRTGVGDGTGRGRGRDVDHYGYRGGRGAGGQSAQAARDLLADSRAAGARRCGRHKGDAGWQLIGNHNVLGVGEGPALWAVMV